MHHDPAASQLEDQEVDQEEPLATARRADRQSMWQGGAAKSSGAEGKLAPSDCGFPDILRRRGRRITEAQQQAGKKLRQAKAVLRDFALPAKVEGEEKALLAIQMEYHPRSCSWTGLRILSAIPGFHRRSPHRDLNWWSASGPAPGQPRLLPSWGRQYRVLRID